MASNKKNRAREVYYFAYGSNCNGKQMRRRCPGAVALGLATLAEHRLTFRRWSRVTGVADVERKVGCEVPGILWAITPDHEATLDRCEGVASDVYRKKWLTVNHQGLRIQALVYVMAPGCREHDPAEDYLGVIARAYKAWKLPLTNLKDALLRVSEKMEQWELVDNRSQAGFRTSFAELAKLKGWKSTLEIPEEPWEATFAPAKGNKGWSWNASSAPAKASQKGKKKGKRVSKHPDLYFYDHNDRLVTVLG
ncbi:MAG: gamma-glutamylcyclotransferase [Deltaproteobacteria bacterium]|nr:gamma-glutamylcyclotransferase [Deltaproteobacteria bacterium]